jgi:hypothetical protein
MNFELYQIKKLNDTVIFRTVSENQLKKYHMHERQKLKTIKSINDFIDNDTENNEKEEVKFSRNEEKEKENNDTQ